MKLKPVISNYYSTNTPEKYIFTNSNKGTPAVRNKSYIRQLSKRIIEHYQDK